MRRLVGSAAHPRFRTLVADPPWPYKDKLPGKGRGAAKHYALLGPADIRGYLHLGLSGYFPEHLADDALLFLWRVGPMQDLALEVMKAWGFKYGGELVWVKTTVEPVGLDCQLVEMGGALDNATTAKLHFGMGRVTRAAHEVCLIGKRGRPAILNHSTRSVFFAPVGEHSAKPEAFYRTVEKLSPGPRLELFARRQRPGWVQHGLELENQ